MISVFKNFDNPPKGLLGEKPQITKEVKKQLWELYNKKCAFSEKPLAFGEMQVHHYRPISQYPELEFEWSNLLPVSKEVAKSLGGVFKTQNKPVSKEKLQNPENRKANAPCLLAEEPLLLHPEVDTPENHFGINQHSPKLVAASEKGEFTLNFIKLEEKQHAVIQAVRRKLNQLTTLIRETYEQQDFQSNKENRPSLDLIKKYHVLAAPHLADLTEYTEAFQPFSLRCKLLIEQTFLSPIMVASPTQRGAQLNMEVRELLPLIFKSYLPRNKKEWLDCQFPQLLSLKVARFHSIKKLSLNTIPVNTRWLFLTGENGAGKSLFLQAIALGFIPNPKDIFIDIDDNLRIEQTIHNTTRPIKCLLYNNNFNAYNWDTFHQFAAYGPGRLHTKEAYTNQRNKEEKLYSIFNHTNKLENIESYLSWLGGRNNEQFTHLFDEISSVLLRLLPNVEKMEVDDSQVEKRIVYRESTLDGGRSGPLSFHQLSAGSKNIIAMIGDMIIQLIRYQSIDSLKDLQGIVLIDEIDIHLHAKWQKEFVRLLTQLFPKIQFIASTHSPIPLLGAPKESIILNVSQPSKQEGILVEQLDIDVTKLTPNTILSSPIFGFDGILSVAHEEDDPLYTQETYNDVLFEQHLNKKLEEYAEEKEVDLDELLNNKSDD